ncbi:autotransporter assembly complex family protein [Herbaspirillum sp. RV1423]|uniref:autotransporter assembly complex protein TamA n=1 Tax=Herbaspirillum sp. RV1423 TaxID=1443993 RepID=UPI000557ACCD|nr:autotransporter assembly complex family protein [Herbaspirillum sp. RV1423]
MKWTCRLAIALLSCATGSAYAAYKVEITAPAPLQKLLEKHLDLVRYQNREDLSEEQLKFLLDTVNDQVVQLASTEGYFSPTTTINVEQIPGSKPDDQKYDKRVQLHVNAGPRTKISTVDIGATGTAAENDPQRIDAIRKDWSLPVGAPFRQEDWDNAKNQGLEKLQQHKYAAARIARSQASIDPDDQQADLSVQYDSGPRFTLGPLQITGTRRYPESIIRNVNPLNVGEEYDVNRLLSLQRQIQNTPYFSNAIIGIDNDPENADMAPVKVQVTEFPTQRIRTGIGYATDTGAQVEGRYSHYNVFNKAYAFDSQLRLEQKRQYGLLNLAMPPDGKNFVNSVNTSMERTRLEGVDLRSLRAGIKRARNGELYDTAYTLTYYRDELQQENGATLPANTVITQGKHQALVPGFSWVRRNVDDPIFPRHGNLLTLETGFAVKGVITDQTFGRLYARFKQYVPVAKRDLIILRTDLGGVFTKGAASEVPASLLFRAGGNDSVRGYSYDSIGNEQNGTVYPTKYLVTGSAEYQRWFTEKWGAAVFYDVGTAADSWENKTFYSGVGAGARWRSPVGSLNLDLAYGVQKKQFRPHISLGIAF